MLFRLAEDFKRRALELGVPVIAADSSADLSEEMPFVRFSIEELSNAKIALARMLVSWLGEFRDCEFWVSEFGIWPSSEDWNLYVRLRNANGDSRELCEAPSHLFKAIEKADLETYLSIAIQFGWGGHIVPNAPRTYLFLSHDGWVHAASSEFLPKIKEDLEEWEIAYEVGGRSPGSAPARFS